MRRVARLLSFLAVSFAMAFFACGTAWVLPPSKRHRFVSAVQRAWARSVCSVLGISVEVRGDVPRGGPWLAVSNHLGYLDVPALASVLPVSFVSKSEVRRWPLIGFLAAAGGTIFVDREDRIAAPDFIRRVRSRLSAGGNVLLFPEGTSSRGETVLPFHSSPFASADEPGTRLLPLAVELLEVDGKRASGGVRDLACWHGDMTFAGHFFRFLALRGARFRVTIGPPFDCRSLDRKEAAAFTRSQVLGLMSAGKFTNS